MKRKVKVIVLFCIFGLLCFFFPIAPKLAFAEDKKTASEMEQEINQNVEEFVEDLNLSKLDELVNSLCDDQRNLFGLTSFTNKVKSIINGEFANGFDNLWSAILNLIFDNLLDFIPVLALMVAVAVLASLFSSIKSSGGVGEIIHLICFGVIAIIVVKYVSQFVVLTTSVISQIKVQSEIVFPVLLTLLSTMGGLVSVNVYQPAVLLFTNLILKVFSGVMISLFVFSFIFNVLSNITSRVKFKKFGDFFSSLFKWLVGIMFTIFMAYLALQGITASVRDSVSIRTAKYAMRSYVPLLGGYLSEGLDLILASLLLIKNAVGIGAILVLGSLVLIPIIQIAMFSLGLKLVGAITEPICDGRISGFTSSVGKSLSMLNVIIIGASFMFLIMCGLIVLTANVF